LVYGTGNCDQYLFDAKGKNALFEGNNFTPVKRGYKKQLRSGLLYAMYKEEARTRSDFKKLAVHIRIGDCWHTRPEYINNELIANTMKAAINSGHKFGRYNNVENPSPHGRFSPPNMYIETIANVENKYGRNDQQAVLSDGFTRLASELNQWTLDNRIEIDRKATEQTLNDSYFSSFLELSPSPKLIVGEAPKLLVPSLIELMLADTLVVGNSALPLALRCAYEIPIGRIFSASKRFNPNIDFESFGLSAQKL
jgi:hypothetical protein